MGTDVAGGNEIWRTLSLKLPGVYRFFPCSRRGVSKPGGPDGPPGLLRFARLQSALGSLPSVALPSVHEDRVSEAGGFYEQKELVEARSLWSKRRREDHPSAEREIARIKDLQRAWEMRSQDAEQTVLHEPALIGVGPVEFLAHMLVRPAASNEESLRYDAEVERVAMELAMAHERALGARVQDVHTPELSLHAGLNTPHPGFDVLSHRADGSRRCIVKPLSHRTRSPTCHWWA